MNWDVFMLNTIYLRCDWSDDFMWVVINYWIIWYILLKDWRLREWKKDSTTIWKRQTFAEIVLHQMFT